MTCSIIVRMALSLALCLAVTHGFCAFVQQQQPPATLRTKPLNMTRKASKPPRAAWDQVDQQVVQVLLDDELVEEWDFPLEYLDDDDENVDCVESSMDNSNNNNNNNLAWGLDSGILAQKKHDILSALPRLVLPVLMQQQQALLGARGGNQELRRLTFVPHSAAAPGNRVAMAAGVLESVVAAQQQQLSPS